LEIRQIWRINSWGCSHIKVTGELIVPFRMPLRVLSLERFTWEAFAVPIRVLN